ncbi:Hsp20/alpha crystallin family protein [Candidatus Protochlamydia phocaeensis]|uniref:Hsp20/alpha crystallin family protein n=1 Tax=Candidatus Protochlamydia phocaeensis TaxID=1414722 RepID=UPI000838C3A1|nr:Hsp20/alpha crystallin family protein [Candidatus Protochlamydia phocaeensis]
MAEEKKIKVQQKQQAESKEEQIIPGKTYIPSTDIYETDKSLFILMDMPGVKKGNIDIHLEKNNLEVTGKIETQTYEGLKPIHTEYNIGHFQRAFVLSNKIEQNQIEASMQDGVLTLELPKKQEPQPRKIQIK